MSSDGTFTTLGTNVTITVVNQQTNKPINGAKVSYGNQTVTTNEQGQTTLTNLLSKKC